MFMMIDDRIANPYILPFNLLNSSFLAIFTVIVKLFVLLFEEKTVLYDGAKPKCINPFRFYTVGN